MCEIWDVEQEIHEVYLWYIVNSISDCRPHWTPASNWTSPVRPVYYDGFDHEECLNLTNGAQLVEGQVMKEGFCCHYKINFGLRFSKIKSC